MKLFALVSLVAVMLTAGASFAVPQAERSLDPSQQSSAQSAQQSSQQAPQQFWQPQSAATEPDKSRIVYVSDFELDAVDVNGKLQKSVPAIPPSNAPRFDSRQEAGPVEQAGRLVDFMSSSLVRELEKAGYTTRRLRPGETRPSDGIRISGIFGEPDTQNRLRRAVLGRVPADGTMSLFVGIGNLARPDQALYATADPLRGDNRAGAVITVSSYAPVAKFEIEKNATEKDLKDTATGIVRGLSALLSANVAAMMP